MKISYNKLWKLMIDKKLKKKFLLEEVGLTRTTVSNLNHDKHISTESLLKICSALHCEVGDVMDIIPDEDETKDKGNVD